MVAHKVVITDNIFPNLEMERRRLSAVGAELIEADPQADMLTQVKDADVIINVYYKITADLIENLEKCRLIIRNGIGFDTIDVAAASKKGIMVANVPTYCQDEVATHTATLILACSRKITYLNHKVKAGSWDYKLAEPINAPRVSTVGLVGFGRIAQTVRAKIKCFGFRVISFDPYVSQEQADKHDITMVDMDTLIRESDYISIHCPLTDATRHSFNYETFKQMKPTAFLINTSRGAVVKEKELVRALEEGLIAGAALDVLETDGIDLNNPLCHMDNVIITPHAAWYSEQSIIQRREDTMESVIRVLRGGEPVSFINKDALKG